jgi:hypothetical protein
MSLDRDAILLDNLRASLDLYQRSLVWAMTAAAAFFVLTLSLGDSNLPSISVLYGQLSGPAAWFVALGLFFVLGILAGSALRNAEAVLGELHVPREVVDAALLYPSLATSRNGPVRVGTVIFPPITVLIAFAIELQREAASSAPRTAAWWLGLLMFVVLVAAPYAAIAGRVWHHLGSRPRKALPS